MQLYQQTNDLISYGNIVGSQIVCSGPDSARSRPKNPISRGESPETARSAPSEDQKDNVRGGGPADPRGVGIGQPISDEEQESNIRGGGPADPRGIGKGQPPPKPDNIRGGGPADPRSIPD